MSTRNSADDLVQFKSPNLETFKRNAVKSVVCEFRFPTLLELGETKVPAKFSNALRKSYPIMELGTDVNFGIGVAAETSYSHVFRSMKGGWAVSLKHSSLTIETSNYTGYADLRRRVLEVVAAAEPVIDSDFWTRMGLRYMNSFDGRLDAVGNEWVNPALLMPILSGSFRGINEFSGRMHLAAEDGGVLLQTGIKANIRVDEIVPPPDYLIDIDCYRNEVIVGDTARRLDAMHAQAFDMFDWTIAGPAREYLSR